MVKRVDSCPPCKELLDVKVAKGLSIRSPEAHIVPVQSKKYLRDAKQYDSTLYPGSLF